MVSWKEPERTSIAAAAVDVSLLEMSSTLKALGREMTRYWKALFVPLQTSSSLLHRSVGLGVGEGDGESDMGIEVETVGGDGESDGEGGEGDKEEEETE